MTDIENVREMLTRAGVPFKVELTGRGNDWLPELPEGCTSISAHGAGYCDFYTEFIFRVDGSLLTVAAWE